MLKNNNTIQTRLALSFQAIKVRSMIKFFSKTVKLRNAGCLKSYCAEENIFRSEYGVA